MPLEHHPFIREFPQYRELVHRLKEADETFRELFDEYHRVDRELFRIGREIEPASDARTLELKRQRLQLEDRLLAMLGAARRPAEPTASPPEPET